jgi:hypothetical protein
MDVPRTRPPPPFSLIPFISLLLANHRAPIVPPRYCLIYPIPRKFLKVQAGRRPSLEALVE